MSKTSNKSKLENLQQWLLRRKVEQKPIVTIYKNK